MPKQTPSLVQRVLQQRCQNNQLLWYQKYSDMDATTNAFSGNKSTLTFMQKKTPLCYQNYSDTDEKEPTYTKSTLTHNPKQQFCYQKYSVTYEKKIL